MSRMGSGPSDGSNRATDMVTDTRMERGFLQWTQVVSFDGVRFPQLTQFGLIGCAHRLSAG